jgi:hypothetical protein
MTLSCAEQAEPRWWRERQPSIALGDSCCGIQLFHGKGYDRVVTPLSVGEDFDDVEGLGRPGGDDGYVSGRGDSWFIAE